MHAQVRRAECRLNEHVQLRALFWRFVFVAHTGKQEKEKKFVIVIVHSMRARLIAVESALFAIFSYITMA
jgi:hypothetical protein